MNGLIVIFYLKFDVGLYVFLNKGSVNTYVYTICGIAYNITFIPLFEVMFNIHWMLKNTIESGRWLTAGFTWRPKVTHLIA